MRDEISPLKALQSYLQVVTVSLMGSSHEFARDLETIPAVNRLIEDHNAYVFSATRRLLELADAWGEIPSLDLPALAMVMARLGWALTRPEIKRTLASSPKEAADSIVDVMIRGLRLSPGVG